MLEKESKAIQEVAKKTGKAIEELRGQIFIIDKVIIQANAAKGELVNIKDLPPTSKPSLPSLPL